MRPDTSRRRRTAKGTASCALAAFVAACAASDASDTGASTDDASGTGCDETSPTPCDDAGGDDAVDESTQGTFDATYLDTSEPSDVTTAADTANDVILDCDGCAPTNGLIAYYPFNGNADDATSNPANGTVHGAILISDRFNMAARAYAFNGSSAYIDASAVKLPLAHAARTASVWFQTSSTVAYQSTFNWGTDVTDERFGISVHTTGLNFTAQGDDVDGTAVVTDSVWHNALVTYDGGTQVVVYVDGVQYAMGTVAQLNTTGAKLVIGRKVPASNNEYFNGALDDIRIYNRVLSSAEIALVYHDGGWP